MAWVRWSLSSTCSASGLGLANLRSSFKSGLVFPGAGPHRVAWEFGLSDFVFMDLGLIWQKVL